MVMYFFHQIRMPRADWEVVPVHDDMDEEVEGDGHPGDGGDTDELGVAEEGRGAMVVCMEEGEGLLFEDKEDGVEEFDEFGEVIELPETVNVML